jgi:predicted PurR-regulated permease PerM
MKIEPSALTRDRVLAWTLLLGTVLILALCVAIALPFIPALAWAAALAILTRRMHGWIERHIPNRSFAAFVSVVIVAVVVIAPMVWIGFRISQEVADGLKHIQTSVKSGAVDAALHRHPALLHAYDWLNDRIDLAAAAIQAANALQGHVARLIAGAVRAIVQGFICLFALFFFFRDRGEISKAVRARLPLKENEIRLLLARLKNMVRATVFGRLLTASLQGVLGGLMFWILGIDAPLLWGAAMALLSTIPAVGSIFVWAPAAVWLALSGHWVKAIILAAWGSGIVGTIDNIVYPLLVGRDVKIHTLLLFMALLGGVLLFGVTGLILGPVLVETGLSLIEILRERTRAGDPIEQKS